MANETTSALTPRHVLLKRWAKAYASDNLLRANKALAVLEQQQMPVFSHQERVDALKKAYNVKPHPNSGVRKKG